MTDKKDFWSQTDIGKDRYAFRIQREIPTDTDKLEQLLHDYNNGALTLEDRKEYQEKRKERVEKVFKVASAVLTDIQYQIFTAYHVIGMSELDIADSFNVTQPYISIVLTASAKKIRKHLNLY